ncbi:MAG: tRNA (guanosine(46)-N7)-methyltransferase TrmB [Paludibacteraceae bacterium]|nr:tRNA (guanosine(46)-N7)-methyltransferase TrmB [Paludibacteraceae bacterium]
MGKNKLKKFAELKTLPNVFECGMSELDSNNAVAQLRSHWHEQVFHNTNPIVLELGCGRGDYTVGLAKRYTDKNFIGIDIKGARLWAGAKQAYAENLGNVAFLRINIELLPQFFAIDEVSEIWLTFPDPQMKKATKRLTSTYFMQRYKQVMPVGGLVHLKTDSPFLYTYTAAMLSDSHSIVLADTYDLYGNEDYTNPLFTDARALQTYYEQQWLARGMKIKYLCWQLQTDGWVEPTIEIEKDSYRSFGRNYQTTNIK